MPLDLTPRIADPDALFERLVELHNGLDTERSAVASAKLILLLANHIGDAAVIGEAIALAGAVTPTTRLTVQG